MKRFAIALLLLVLQSVCWGQNVKATSVTLLHEQNDASQRASDAMARRSEVVHDTN